MRLAAASWPEVDTYLKSSNRLIVPIGSTEQHGPTGLLGTDHLTADAIARGVGEQLGVYVAPPVCYGVASHHMAFAGSATIRPATYLAMLADILKSFYRHGFRRFHLVNGHGGNEHSVRATFQDLKGDGLEGATFSLYNWWRLREVETLAQELYGDREGFHATPSEVSLTFHLEGLKARPYEYRPGPKEIPWPLTATETRRVFPDGVMRADPGLARPEHGERFFKVAVECIAASISRAVAIES